MTSGMSLRGWDKTGQLSRELNIYQKLGELLGHVYIYSYGKNEKHLVKEYPNITVLDKFWYFPGGRIWPKRISKLFNPIYNYLSIILRRRIFEKIDIIKTNQLTAGEFPVKLRMRFGKKLVIRMGYYFSDIKQVHQKQLHLERKILKTSDHIFITDEESRLKLIRYFNLKPECITTIPNYINTNQFKPLDLEKSIDLLFIGRFTEQKNLVNLIKGLKDFNFQRILFVGNGRKKSELVHLGNQYNLNIELVTKIANHKLPEIYNRSQIFLLPSLYEGNPKVLLEAMACGNLVIGSRVRGITNIITDGINGFLCGIDPESIQSTVIKALKTKSDEREKMKQNARDFILKHYSLENNIHLEKKAYEHLL